MTDETMKDRERAAFSLCACLGPIKGEPMCPCAMKRAGLRIDADYEPSADEKERLRLALSAFCGENARRATQAEKPFRAAVEEMVTMLENGEWAEHASTLKAPGDELASRLEAAITALHNDHAAAPQAALSDGQRAALGSAIAALERNGWTNPATVIRDLLAQAPTESMSDAACDMWQPISTAPRDGTNILIRFGRDGVSQAAYVPGVPHPWKFIDTNDGITWLINGAVDNEYGPSHWMPMPNAARKAEIERDGGVPNGQL